MQAVYCIDDDTLNLMCKREAVLLLAPYPGGAYGMAYRTPRPCASRLHHNLILFDETLKFGRMVALINKKRVLAFQITSAIHGNSP